MLRHKALVRYSHQHQHALALCVRLDRELQQDALAEQSRLQWQKEIARIFKDEIRAHFAAEEELLFPLAGRFESMVPLIQELLSEHQTLLSYADNASAEILSDTDLQLFAMLLSDHIRMEERQLFEECQKLIPSADLERMGEQTEEYF
jgi:hemerythrin-like domain-containing protein